MSDLGKAILVSILIGPSANTADARPLVVGLSPSQSAVELKAQAEAAVQHMLETVEPGESALVFDAYNNRLIGTLRVPAGAGYANPRAKLAANRELVGALKAFIDTAEPVPGRIGAVDLPGLLSAVQKNYPAPEGADLIVLGSPLFDDPQAPSLNMRGGAVPGDGHIAARAGQSPFATAGLPGTLEGYDVYFGIVGEDWGVSTAHEYAVERFWSLESEARGGSLQYFGDDLATLFERAGTDAPDQHHADELVPTSKLEIMQFSPDTGVVAGIYTAPLALAPAPSAILSAATNVTIGITWDCATCDLDLYLRPNPSAPVIYFGQARTADGQLFKDYRSSPNLTNGFETVSLPGPIDFEAMRLAVNFYGGRADQASVGGELRIAVGEQVWAQPFVLDARDGNTGEGAQTVITEGITPNDHWLLIDPVSVLADE